MTRSTTHGRPTAAHRRPGRRDRRQDSAAVDDGSAPLEARLGVDVAGLIIDRLLDEEAERLTAKSRPGLARNWALDGELWREGLSFQGWRDADAKDGCSPTSCPPAVRSSSSATSTRLDRRVC